MNEYLSDPETCPTCDGLQHFDGHACGTCKGTGTVTAAQAIATEFHEAVTNFDKLMNDGEK